MGLYANQKELSEYFGLSRPTVTRRVSGIRKEIEKGRYSQYAIADRLVNKGVFLDYQKNHKRLEDKNLRKTVPPFNPGEVQNMLMD